MAFNPTREGMTALARFPGMLAAELAWRWSFAIATGALLLSSALQFAQSLHVPRGIEAGLRSENLFVVALALSQLLAGTGPRLARMAAVLAPAIAVLWIVAASIGRLVTLRELMAGESVRKPLLSLLALNTLRAALTLAAAIAYVGAAIVAGKLAAGADPAEPLNVPVFYLVFLVLMCVIVGLWTAISWFLNLAPVFIVARGSQVLAAVGEAVGLFRRHRADFVSVSAAFGSIKFAVMVVFTVVFLAIGVTLAVQGTAVVLAVVFFAGALYSVVANMLFIGRLHGYIAILRHDEAGSAAPEPQVMPLGAQPVV